jgi:hypothetical protein
MPDATPGGHARRSPRVRLVVIPAARQPDRCAGALYVRRARSVLLVLVSLVLAQGALAQGDIERSAFAPVVTELLASVHAVIVACDVAVERSTICFTLMPGRVAQVAEALEALLEEHAGALVRSAWRSGNGVHHVELLLDDDLWGVLELWLSEPGDRSVSGMLKYVTRRRGAGP